MPDFTKKLTNRLTMSPDDPARKRRPISRKGNVPDAKLAPLTLAELHDASGVWRLAWLRNKYTGIPSDGPEQGWYNLKLYVLGTALHKANYWVSWNAEGKRLKAWLDTRAINLLNPKLAQMLTQTLTHMWSASFNPESGGLQVSRWIGDAISVQEDLAFNALAYGEPMTFSASDRARLRELGTLIQAERGHRGWTMVPDELTGGFTLVTK